HFQRTDVYNKYYNPGGILTASEYRFPFEDAEFDFVYLTSVFTHMLRRDVEHYLEEIARVLRPGGRCLASFFLLDERTNPGRARTGFPDAAEGCQLRSREMPEWEVAYEESEARLMYAQSGLQIQEPIRYGIQDSVVAVKP
ncbi:MAG: class I SAM-dependent methyltransferase, partial [Armatimonadota bacterium]|nr:class I SAM-dependent methyltransferase [Armatimonadota bacterium]